MKVILSSKRRHHLARVSIFFLIVAGLIVWMTGCYTCFPRQYTLIISSTEGGSVTDPGEGTFTYNSGTVVDLVATPDAGYHFVEWTGDVGTIADVYAAATNITMNGSYNITANFAEGQLIQTWYDLDTVRDNLGGNYTLMNDLDSTTAGYEELASETANEGKGWQPIGTYDDSFTGTFDGQGYEIQDLFIDRPEEDGIGLFIWVGEGGVVKNVGVVEVAVAGFAIVGGLVGYNDGTVSDSYSTGSVTGEWYVGGLVGANWDTVSDSYSTGSVTGYLDVGGLVGENYDTVRDSYSTGNITGHEDIGGLVGVNYDTVSDSYSTGSATGYEYVGGLVGVNDGTVSDSYATGSVTGNYSVGGLVGLNEDAVSNSYSTGSVTGDEDVGGLLGESIGTVSNSFWDTETSGQATSDGGTGKATAQMKDITTFSGATWDIIGVDNPGDRNTGYVWNIVDDDTYPFLSWEP